MSAILSDRDKSLVRNFLLGGAGIGGGAALATALVNYLKHLNENKNEEDDDTIRIYKDVPQEKVAMTLGGPLAMTGGVLGAAGTYALVNKLYELLRKKQAQEELDKAQNIFIESQGYKKAPDKKEDDGEEKQASAMSIGEAAVSFPLALPLLLALGSGVVAHKMLNKAFPIKKKKVQAPKRIEIIDAPEDVAEEDAAVKEAGVSDSDGAELLFRTVSMNKKASSDLKNLIGAASAGDIGEFKKAAKLIGYANALDTVKGMGDCCKNDPLTEQIAISYLAKSAAVGPQTGILAAGEFAELYPSFYKMASELSETKQNALYKIACILGNAIRSEIAEEAGISRGKVLTKKASASDDLLEALLERGDDIIPDSTNDTNKSSEMSKDEGNVKNKKKFTYSSKRGLELAKAIQDDDAIDKILQPKQN